MNNQKKISAGLLIVMILGVIFFSSKRAPTATVKTESPQKIQEQTEKQQTKATQIVGVPEHKKNNITSSDITSLRNVIPDKTKVKEEFKESPHTTPISLRKFANSMGPLMDKAIRNDLDAYLLNHELYECALDESVAEAARASCVVNSERLVKLYPQMKVKKGDLRANVSPEVQKILDTRDKFINK